MCDRSVNHRYTVPRMHFSQLGQRRFVLPLVVAAAVGGAMATAPVAGATTYRASETDPTGDAPAPGRDITEVKFRYTTAGSVLIVLTMAGPIDAAGADAGVGVSVGSSCNKLIFTGAGLFSEPDPVAFIPVKGKKLLKPKKGAGEITNNVYTLKVKNSAFKNQKPKCLAVALIDPATAENTEPTLFDQTDELKIKKS